MSIENNKHAMNRFVEFINTASEILSKELISANARFYVPGQPEPLRGPAGYLNIINMMRSGFPDIQWELEEMVAENEKWPHVLQCGEHIRDRSLAYQPHQEQ